MPKISNKVLTNCRERLLEMRESLQQQLTLGKDATATVDLDQSKIGRLSRIDALQQQHMARSAHDNTGHRLRQVFAALSRFQNQTYGECISCGEYIDGPRLLAQPEVERCINCQQQHESS